MKISQLLPLIGIILFAYLLSTLDIGLVSQGFLNINYLFAVAVGIFGFTIVLRAIRWKMIIQSYGISFPLIDSIKGWLIGFSIGLVTPGKVGDFARAYYLKDKARIGRSLTTVMTERVIDVVVLFILSLIGLSLFVTFYLANDFLLIVTLGFFALFVVGVFLFSRKEIASFLLRPFYRRLIPAARKESVKNVYHDFYQGVDVTLRNKRLMFLLILFTLLIWIVIVYYTWLIGVMIDPRMTLEFLFIIVPFIGLVFALPISLSGLGTREASFIFFLSFIGISPEAAVTFSLLHLLSDYVLGAIGFVLWYRNPIDLKGIRT